MDITTHLKEIKNTLPSEVKLIAVSKTKSPEKIIEAYNCGQRIFGENKAQELVDKYEKLPKDIEWHFIGHLQSNKAKYIAPFVSMVHSIDSLKILKTINKEAQKNNRIIPCLLQFHIATEATKFGFSEDEIIKILNSQEINKLNNILICGVMGMATFTDNTDQIHKEFKMLKKIFIKLKKEYFESVPEFSEISMGMSDDYPIAIEEGSTMVRIGSKIFGSR